MSHIRMTIFGALASAALLTSAGGAIVAASTAAPNGVSAATAIEYGATHGPTAVE